MMRPSLHPPGCLRSEGYSLLEVLIVLLILGILAAVAIGALLPAVDKARYVAAQQEVLLLSHAMDSFIEDVGLPPSTGQGLGALVHNPGSLKWRGPYARQSALIDPWGRPYAYLRWGADYCIWTLSRDGEAGGAGYDGDIVRCGSSD